MRRELRERRDLATEKHDAALGRWPTREGPEFRAELEAVVAELNSVAVAVDEPSADPVEVSKTFRWLGDAYFDLGLGTNKAMLSLGVVAYQRSEELLADADSPVEKAKLDFNYGNTLRGLSGGSDAGLLEAAQTRYVTAIRAFRSNHLSDHARTVEMNLRTLEPQIRLVHKHGEIQRSAGRLPELMEEMEEAAPAERERIAKELSEIKERRGRGNPSEAMEDLLAALIAQVEEHPERFGGDFGHNLQQLEGQMTSLGDILSSKPTAGRDSASRDMERAITDAIQDRLESDAKNGKVSVDRVNELGNIFGEFVNTMSSGGDDLESLRARTHKMRELANRVIDKGLNPSWSSTEPEPGSRAHRIVRMLNPLMRFLAAEKSQNMLPTEVASAGTDLMTRIPKLEVRVRENQNDDTLMSELEGEAWRLATEVQRHARRDHVMIAAPYFSTSGSHASPKSVFISGGKRVLSAACRIDDLEIFSEAQGGNFTRVRWNQLVSATVTVFDISLRGKADRAQVYYELGLALALGKPIVIVIQEGQIIPFNIRDDFPFLTLTLDDQTNAESLADAIWGALGAIAWGGREAGLGAGLRDGLSWLDSEYPEIVEGHLRFVHDAVARAASEGDAVAFRKSTDQLLGMLGADAPMMSLPAWPPLYPVPSEKPRCFHVTPFGPSWAPKSRDLIAETCEANGWVYTRGDESEEQRIVRGIWTEIARASAVVIDVTGLNENVALELGLVHALGRNHRVVVKGDPAKHMFPSIAKIQIHSYGKLPQLKNLQESVDGLLKSTREREL